MGGLCIVDDVVFIVIYGSERTVIMSLRMCGVEFQSRISEQGGICYGLTAGLACKGTVNKVDLHFCRTRYPHFISYVRNAVDYDSVGDGDRFLKPH